MPTSVVLVGLLGLLVLGFGLARIVFLELRLHRTQAPAVQVRVAASGERPGFRAAA
jgi:hypothetical protein